MVYTLKEFFDSVENSYSEKIDPRSNYYAYLDLDREADLKKIESLHDVLCGEYALIPISPNTPGRGMIIDLPRYTWAMLDSGLCINEALAKKLEKTYTIVGFGYDIYAMPVHEFFY